MHLIERADQQKQLHEPRLPEPQTIVPVDLCPDCPMRRRKSDQSPYELAVAVSADTDRPLTVIEARPVDDPRPERKRASAFIYAKCTLSEIEQAFEDCRQPIQQPSLGIWPKKVCGSLVQLETGKSLWRPTQIDKY